MSIRTVTITHSEMLPRKQALRQVHNCKLLGGNLSSPRSISRRSNVARSNAWRRNVARSNVGS